MVTVLDTARLAPEERRPAQVAARLEATMSSRIRFLDPYVTPRARLDAWDLGGISVLRADLTGELVLSRSPRQAREDTEPVVSFAVQELGVAVQDHRPPGRLEVVGQQGPPAQDRGLEGAADHRDHAHGVAPAQGMAAW